MLPHGVPYLEHLKHTQFKTLALIAKRYTGSCFLELVVLFVLGDFVILSLFKIVVLSLGSFVCPWCVSCFYMYGPSCRSMGFGFSF